MFLPKSISNKSADQTPEIEKRKYRCAFTGHRPEKIIGSEGQIIVELRREILKAIDEGYIIVVQPYRNAYRRNIYQVYFDLTHVVSGRLFDTFFLFSGVIPAGLHRFFLHLRNFCDSYEKHIGFNCNLCYNIYSKQPRRR